MENKLIIKETGKDPLYKTWHSNSCALIMYVYSGTGSIVTAERSFPIEPNALIMIAPGTYHYTIPEQPEIYIRSKLILLPSVFDSVITLLSDYTSEQRTTFSPVVCAHIPDAEQARVDRIFSELAQLDNDQDMPLLVAASLQLVHYLLKFVTAKTDMTPGVMNKAIRYINQNISEQLTLDRICEAVSLSKYHFCRQFKQQFGMTVMLYILRTRLILAREALENTVDPISEICDSCGFSSVSYFCQAFKQETGISPLQYRKKIRMRQP